MANRHLARRVASGVTVSGADLLAADEPGRICRVHCGCAGGRARKAGWSPATTRTSSPRPRPARPAPPLAGDNLDEEAVGPNSAGRGPSARACVRLAIRYFTASMVRNAVTTAIRMGAVCSAPTWVRNAAISTIENGAGASDPGTAASRQVNASPSGTPGMTWCTRTPAVPPMNSEGKIGPPMNPLRLADREREHLGDQRWRRAGPRPGSQHCRARVLS